jgi:molybdenum cofactor cytidylyltransferase
MPNRRLAVLIVAAGSSSRLGQPKQLVPWKKTTLLGHVIDCAKAVTDQVFVVLGANKDQIISEVTIENSLYFSDWEMGMGASISFGLQNIMQQIPKIESVLILVCDQPYVSAKLLKQLIERYTNTDDVITASCYDNINGVPAIFSKEVIPDLLALSGDKGAKGIISHYETNIGLVAFPEGLKDIDTPEDLQHLSD